MFNALHTCMHKYLCSNIDELDKHLSQHKAWLADASIKLSLTIRFVRLIIFNICQLVCCKGY